MKIKVSDINREGLALKESFPISRWDIDSDAVKFVDCTHIEGAFLRSEDVIIVNANITFNRKIKCARCLDEVCQEVKQDITLTYSGKGSEDYLEIDDDLRQEVLLEYPMKAVCNPECLGICSGCGVNLNHQKCSCDIKTKKKR
ncbi:MAG: DUF177 domain-containing protein [Candidatus Omnitrophota bacterium]